MSPTALVAADSTLGIFGHDTWWLVAAKVVLIFAVLVLLTSLTVFVPIPVLVAFSAILIAVPIPVTMALDKLVPAPVGIGSDEIGVAAHVPDATGRLFDVAPEHEVPAVLDRDGLLYPAQHRELALLWSEQLLLGSNRDHEPEGPQDAPPTQHLLEARPLL